MKDQEIVMLEKQLSDAETLLQNLFDERFHLLDEKENLTEDKNILLKCLQKWRKCLNRDYFGGNCMQQTFEKKYIKSIFGDISVLHSSEIRDVWSN